MKIFPIRRGRPAAALAFLATIGVAASCASHGAAPPETAPRVDPALLARVQAELRIVGSESTWVAHGSGYELAALSKTDIALAQPALDSAAHGFALAFDTAPPPIVVALVQPGRDAEAKDRATPVPAGKVPVVQVLVGDGGTRPGAPLGRGGEFEARGRRGGEAPPDREGREGRGFVGAGSVHALSPEIRGPVRAWLSARATALTGQVPLAVQAAGVAPDPRVPAWAEEAVPSLALDSAEVDRLASLLAGQPKHLHTLDSLLVMRHPADLFMFSSMAAGRPGGFGGRGYDGYGGRGAERMGGRDGPARRDSTERPALQGSALFTAQAIVFARYVATHESAAFVGRVIDAQIQGMPWTSVLSKAKALPSNARDLDGDWRRWLASRARG